MKDSDSLFDRLFWKGGNARPLPTGMTEEQVLGHIEFYGYMTSIFAHSQAGTGVIEKLIRENKIKKELVGAFYRYVKY